MRLSSVGCLQEQTSIMPGFSAVLGPTNQLYHTLLIARVLWVKYLCLRLQIRWQKTAGERGRAERRWFEALGVGGLLVLDAGLFAQQQRRSQIARGDAFVQVGASGRVPANHVRPTPRVSILSALIPLIYGYASFPSLATRLWLLN